ncbi:MAG: methyl-accepting chemotaxis protein [Gammaproteobacteria bacterium]|nr:MAG: methyl-accepting chemotaxis protein [Gammaproteobacteria bacterium]
MKLLKNLTIKTKIMLMLMFPMLGLGYFGIYSVSEKMDVAAEMGAIQPLAQLAVKASTLVHETQKERGATAGYLGSKGKKFAQELPAQRSSTDAKRAELKDFLKDFNAETFGNGFKAKLNDALGRLNQIDAKRSVVSSMNIKMGDAISYYTGMNRAFLGVIDHMTKLTENGKVARAIAAYINFLQGKERAGVERAVMSSTFARDSFAPGMLKKFGTLVAEQNSYTNVFLSLATDEAKNIYKQKMSSSIVNEVNSMRQVAYAKANEGGFGIEATVWFRTITGKIGLLKETEDWLSKDLIATVDDLYGSAQTTKVLYIGLVSVIGVLTLLMAFFIALNITGDLKNALLALEDIAEGEGDLTRRLDATGKDEIAKLSDAFNRFAGKIQDMVSQIKNTSGSILNGSQEISTGNIDLSQRTEEQASSLEETASSMEEMTSTVKQNADNARQANQLANVAREQAEKGGSVVSDAINAMAEINGSSKKIADIISVIDEIAFQTNLLALNAAVEAARAGEQGRGFAVVASEVRNLAQRSATAAKEIKDLISDSVDKVKAGSELVDKSGETLTEIVQGVKKVSDIVSEIAAASQEQSSGIDQVNKAVMQMDEMTQQNAALVEEAAAASKSMEEQAKGLYTMVSMFRVDDSDSSKAEVDNVVAIQPVQAKKTVRRKQEKVAKQEPKKSARPAKTGTDDSSEWEEF